MPNDQSNSPSLPHFQQILGIRFFDGRCDDAVEFAVENRGMVVAPSGTCFARLQKDAAYRSAMTEADLALPDSGFMVLLWRLLRGKRLRRISGLAYLKSFAAGASLQERGASFWILPNARARDKFITWCDKRNLPINSDDCYLAPIYGSVPEDEVLITLLESLRPRHIIIGLAGGVQEKLGIFLLRRITYRPTIHCVGGALGFLTGDQVAIPAWADRFYLGWLLRLTTQPRRFLPRLWSGRVLPGLILKWGGNLPPLKSQTHHGKSAQKN